MYGCHFEIRSTIMPEPGIGLIGCGAIGNGLAAAIHQKLRGKLEVRYLNDLLPDRCERLCARHGIRARRVPLEELIDKSDWIIEAASADVAGHVAIEALSRDKTVQVMSVGGLLSCHRRILSLTRSTRGRLLIPSGALAGIDAIKAVRGARIDTASLTSTKPPAALRGAPFFDISGMDVDAISEPTVLYKGNVGGAIEKFPKNVNVAATLGFAVGDPDLVTVTVIASPGATRNSHEILVEGDFGRIVTRTENVPSAENPRTSRLAVLSAFATLARSFDPVDVGS
jgi:aspartate dehydrogenase